MENNSIALFSKHQLGRGLSIATEKRRRKTLTQFARDIAPLAIEKATAELVEDFVFRFRAPATRRAYRSDLLAYFVWACKHRVARSNPVLDTDGIRVPKSLPRPIAPSWLPSVLKTAERDVRIMIALAAYAGLRCAEIAVLQKADIDLISSEPTLAVRCGKGNKDRIVPVHPDLAELLQGVPAGRIVSVTAATVGNKVARHLRSLGIDATAHKLRHTFGSELARTTEGNVVLIAKLMGHESIQTTMGYVGWAGGPATEAIARMYPTAA